MAGKLDRQLTRWATESFLKIVGSHMRDCRERNLLRIQQQNNE